MAQAQGGMAVVQCQGQGNLTQQQIIEQASEQAAVGIANALGIVSEEKEQTRFSKAFRAATSTNIRAEFVPRRCSKHD